MHSLPSQEGFRVLTAAENGPFIVGFVAVGFGGDIAAIQALHHDRNEAQSRIHTQKAIVPILPIKDRKVAQQKISVETKHLPSAPDTLEDIGICVAIPLLGATVLTAASSSLRYWHYRRQARKN